jgi:hypothetical protein
MIHPPLPLDDRLDADRPITPELLAVAARQPLELATRYAELWFGAARTAVESDLVLVFDEFVIGPPCPLVLEAAHHVREIRRARRRGPLDDLDDRDDAVRQWFDRFDDGDDDRDDGADEPDDDDRDPPTIVDRVFAAMSTGPEAERLVHGAVVPRAVMRALDLPIDQWIPAIEVSRVLTLLLAELADGIRIGDGVVVDARLRGEIGDDEWWAA